MVNVIPPDHVDEIPVVEPNQHDDVLVVLEPVLVDEDEDPEEGKFEEEEDPQEEEDDMEVDIEEDGNETELTYLYEEVDPFNPSQPDFESEPKDAIKVENEIKHEDETVPASVHEVGESSTAPFLHEDSDGLLPAHALVKKKGKAKDKYYGKLILDLGNEVRCSVEQGTATMEKLVEKLGNVKDKVECKKLKKELGKAGFSNTFLRMKDERDERDLYWTRAQAHEFYQEMIRRGFVFYERPNEAINVPIKDEKSPSSELDAIGCNDLYHFMKQCNYENIDAAIAAEQAREANARNDARGFRPVIGAVEFLRWFKKTKSIFGINECAERKKVRLRSITLWLILKGSRLKVDAYIWGLTDNVKGKVTSSKPVNLNEAVRMAYKLMEQKSQARDEIILEGKKQKWENFQSGNGSGWAQDKVKQEEVGEIHGQAYAIKDAKPKGPNVVTGMFLLNNRYAFVLLDLSFDRNFVDTRFSSMLNIDPFKIGASNKVELADGRVVSTNTVLKGHFEFSEPYF
nr:reverse transcriptase domain-containing protein [Tanacetum cinerariifolium]